VSRYQKVDVAMWGDENFRALSKPSPNARDCWIHLLTNRETTSLPGVFRAFAEALARDLEWPIDEYLRVFEECQSIMALKADWQAGLIFLPNALKRNRPPNPNVVKGWAKIFIELPECPLKNVILQHIRHFLEPFRKPFREPFGKPFGKRFRDGSGNRSENNSNSSNSKQQQQQHVDRFSGGLSKKEVDRLPRACAREPDGPPAPIPVDCPDSSPGHPDETGGLAAPGSRSGVSPSGDVAEYSTPADRACTGALRDIENLRQLHAELGHYDIGTDPLESELHSRVIEALLVYGLPTCRKAMRGHIRLSRKRGSLRGQLFDAAFPALVSNNAELHRAEFLKLARAGEHEELS